MNSRIYCPYFCKIDKPKLQTVWAYLSYLLCASNHEIKSLNTSSLFTSWNISCLPFSYRRSVTSFTPHFYNFHILLLHLSPYLQQDHGLQRIYILEDCLASSCILLIYSLLIHQKIILDKNSSYK